MKATFRRRAFSVLALSSALLGTEIAYADVIAPAAAPSRGRFEAQELRFRIWFPTEPVRSESVRGTWVGEVSEIELRAELSGAEFVVQLRELPMAARWLVTQSYIFAQVKDGFLEGGERPELFDEPITRGGYAGRHIRYEDPERGEDWIEDVLIFLGEDRLYFVVAARSRAEEANLPIEAFFSSFELW